MDVAEPSFRIWKLSISSGFKPAIAELINVSASPEERSSAPTSMASSMITPSTTHKGLELPYIEVAPRTRILGAVPKVPDTFCTDTPAERPSRPRLISAIPSILMFSAFNWSVAPVNIRLSIRCIPVTTTSDSVCTSDCRITFIVGEGESDWGSIPT